MKIKKIISSIIAAAIIITLIPAMSVTANATPTPITFGILSPEHQAIAEATRGAVVGDWIYYTISAHFSTLNRIKIDGTDKTTLFTSTSSYASMSVVIIYGDWIYFDLADGFGGFNRPVRRISTDIPAQTATPIFSFYIGGASLDYNFIDGVGWVLTYYPFYVEGEWIYYKKIGVYPDSTVYDYRIRLDGTDEEQVQNSTKPTTHPVTVRSMDSNDTTGDGIFAAGATVNISAGTPPKGEQFSHWVTASEGVIFANANSASTSFIMPANFVTVTPRFELISETTRAVTVIGGTGGGNFAAGATVTITAGTPPSGQQFKNWTASPAVTFANADSASTSFTMPANAVTVTANFEPIIVATPTATPTNRTFTSSVNVTLATTTAGAAIYFTTDNSTPVATPSSLYSAPINLTATTTIKAIAVKDGVSSAVLEVTFTRSSSTGGGSTGGGGGGGSSTPPTTPPTTTTPTVTTGTSTWTVTNIPRTALTALNLNSAIPVNQVRVATGQTGNVSVTIGADFIGQNAVLVQFNAETRQLEFVSAATVGTNGNASINVTAAGDFLVLTFKTGDVTGTGEVDTGDALAVLRHAVGLTKLSGIQTFVANGKSGEIDTSDALNILRYAVGLIDRI